MEERALALPDIKTDKALTLSVCIRTVWSWTGIIKMTSGTE